MFFSFNLVSCSERYLILIVCVCVCVCVFFERAAIYGSWNKTYIIVLTCREHIDLKTLKIVF